MAITLGTAGVGPGPKSPHAVIAVVSAALLSRLFLRYNLPYNFIDQSRKQAV